MRWLPFFLFYGFVCSIAQADEDPLAQWGQWRGPLSTGVAPKAEPPVKWSETENVKWKVAVPGKGHSTPVAWGDTIYLTTAEPYGDPVEPVFDKAPGSHDNVGVSQSWAFKVLAYSREDGALKWEKIVHKAFPHEGGHVTGSLASNSPVTDGEFIWAFFGSHGLYCLTKRGESVWMKDLGQMHSKHAHGEGASPALYGDTLVVNWDHEGVSFLYAFDKRTGEQRWKALRESFTSWSTPIVVEHHGKAEVIVSASPDVRSYALDSGELLWSCKGMSMNVVASPVAEDGMVFAGCSYDKRAFLGIRLEGAVGEISGKDQLVWSRNQRTPYVPSPLLMKGTLYFLDHYQGILSCLVAKTGETKAGPFRLPDISDVYASPVGAGEHLYILDRDGNALVLRTEPEVEPVSTNKLDDVFSASPVLMGRELILRGEHFLYNIAAPRE